MSVYPETLIQKLFTYLPITNPLSHDVLRSIQDRGTLIYMSSEIMSFIIAGITIVVLIGLYVHWRSPISRFLFATLLLLGGGSLFYLVFGLTCSALLGTFKICGNDLMLHYFLCASFVPFVLVLYLLCRYAYGYNEKRIPVLQYALFFGWLGMMRCLVFWITNPLARIAYDRKTETANLDMIELGTDHRFVSLCFILLTIVMVMLLHNELYKKAQLRGALIASYYRRLARFTSVFLGVWGTVNLYLYRMQMVNVIYKTDGSSLPMYSGRTIFIDAAPLWIKYAIVLLPYIFYSVFSVWFMYALRQGNKTTDTNKTDVSR